MTHMPEIRVRLFDPFNMRYPTCGDWLYDAESNILEVRVARMPDWRSELAIAIHEAIEAVMCLDKEVSEVEVTEFDLLFEKERGEDQQSEFAEAGDDPRAPYKAQHAAATAVERIVCDKLQIKWEDHEKNVQEV